MEYQPTLTNDPLLPPQLPILYEPVPGVVYSQQQQQQQPLQSASDVITTTATDTPSVPITVVNVIPTLSHITATHTYQWATFKYSTPSLVRSHIWRALCYLVAIIELVVACIQSIELIVPVTTNNLGSSGMVVIMATIFTIVGYALAALLAVTIARQAYARNDSIITTIIQHTTVVILVVCASLIASGCAFANVIYDDSHKSYMIVLGTTSLTLSFPVAMIVIGATVLPITLRHKLHLCCDVND
jgi:hypothetical protein